MTEARKMHKLTVSLNTNFLIWKKVCSCVGLEHVSIGGKYKARRIPTEQRNHIDKISSVAWVFLKLRTVKESVDRRGARGSLSGKFWMRKSNLRDSGLFQRAFGYKKNQTQSLVHSDILFKEFEEWK